MEETGTTVFMKRWVFCVTGMAKVSDVKVFRLWKICIPAAKMNRVGDDDYQASGRAGEDLSGEIILIVVD